MNLKMKNKIKLFLGFNDITIGEKVVTFIIVCVFAYYVGYVIGKVFAHIIG